jgi:hypothetical protein
MTSSPIEIADTTRNVSAMFASCEREKGKLATLFGNADPTENVTKNKL